MSPASRLRGRRGFISRVPTEFVLTGHEKTTVADVRRIGLIRRVCKAHTFSGTPAQALKPRGRSFGSLTCVCTTRMYETHSARVNSSRTTWILFPTRLVTSHPPGRITSSRRSDYSLVKEPYVFRCRNTRVRLAAGVNCGR